MSNEAIHNLAKSKFYNGIFKGEIKDYRLPRVINHARNDCDSRIINMLDDSLPQPLTRLRNDKRAKSAYGLPRVINHARKDARAESNYQSLYKFCKLVRNDKWVTLPRFLMESCNDRIADAFADITKTQPKGKK